MTEQGTHTGGAGRDQVRTGIPTMPASPGAEAAQVQYQPVEPQLTARAEAAGTQRVVGQGSYEQVPPRLSPGAEAAGNQTQVGPQGGGFVDLTGHRLSPAAERPTRAVLQPAPTSPALEAGGQSAAAPRVTFAIEPGPLMPADIPVVGPTTPYKPLVYDEPSTIDATAGFAGASATDEVVVNELLGSSTSWDAGIAQNRTAALAGSPLVDTQPAEAFVDDVFAAWATNQIESAGKQVEVRDEGTVAAARSPKQLGDPIPVFGSLNEKNIHLINNGVIGHDGWTIADLTNYEQQRGYPEPGRNYLSHPLSPLIVPAPAVTVIAEGQIPTNALAAHIGALKGLPKPGEQAPSVNGHVLAIDPSQGANVIKLGAEALANGQSVNLRISRPDIMLALLKPEQFIRYLAEAVYFAKFRGTERTDQMHQDYLAVMRDVYTKLRNTDNKGRHPYLAELVDGLRAIQKPQGAEQELVDYFGHGGNLTPRQFYVLHTAYTPHKLDKMGEVLTACENYLSALIVPTPADVWMQTDLPAADVEIVAIPHTGTHPNKDILDLVYSHWAGWAGDSEVPNLPLQVQIHDAQLYVPDQLLAFRKFFGRRGVRTVFFTQPNVSHEQLLAMGGQVLIGNVSMDAAGPLSEAFSRVDSWELVNISHGTNDSSGEDHSRTRNIGFSRERGRTSALKSNTQHHSSRSRQWGLAWTSGTSTSHGTSSERTEGWRTRPVVPVERLLGMKEQSVLYVELTVGADGKVRPTHKEFSLKNVQSTPELLAAGPRLTDKAKAVEDLWNRGR